MAQAAASSDEAPIRLVSSLVLMHSGPQYGATISYSIGGFATRGSTGAVVSSCRARVRAERIDEAVGVQAQGCRGLAVRASCRPE